MLKHLKPNVKQLLPLTHTSNNLKPYPGTRIEIDRLFLKLNQPGQIFTQMTRNIGFRRTKTRPHS
jgi:hypothetical protein